MMVKLIAPYLKGPAGVLAVLAPLLMALEVVMDLQQPALMADIIDVGVANGDLHYVWLAGLKMLAFAFLGFIGGSGCGILSSIAALKMGERMRQGLFDKIQALSFAQIDALKTPSLITRLTNDVTQVQNMAMLMMRTMVRSPAFCLGSMVMAFMLSPRLALLFCVILPVLIGSILWVLQRSRPLFAQVQGTIDRVNTVMRENLLGIRTIKSFTLEENQFGRFSKVNDELTEESIRAQNLTFLLLPLITLVMNLSVVAILWFSGRMVMAGTLEMGKVMAFINYMVQITNSLLFFVNLLLSLSRAQASVVRIQEVLALVPDMDQPKGAEAVCLPEGRRDLEFRNVSLAYSQGREVLKHLSFTIPYGQSVGIIGPTGSGKSSLVALIPRLYDPTEGQVLLGGVDVRELDPHELRRQVGLVMQESVLFSGTIEDNLRFGNEQASNLQIYRASEKAQAMDFILKKTGKFHEQVEQRGRNFSGGQRQRLAIARTLSLEPEILILDDAGSALDLNTEADLYKAIARTLQGKTLIMIGQRISTVMKADRILVLDRGEIVASGRHEELLAECGIYRSIAVSQLGEEVVAHAIS